MCLPAIVVGVLGSLLILVGLIWAWREGAEYGYEIEGDIRNRVRE